MTNPAITLARAERAELTGRERSRTGRADDARVARTVLLLADGLTYQAIAERVGCPAPDPDFEAKAADVIGLYLHPPHRAAVFCVDEKTAMQALDRLDPACLSVDGSAWSACSFGPAVQATIANNVRHQFRRSRAIGDLSVKVAQLTSCAFA